MSQVSTQINTHNSKKGFPWYFASILGFFALPILFFLKKLKTIDKPALYKSIVTIMALGYAWSYLVSSQGWWVFNPETMLGFEVVLHLPLEEVLFYPLGGALSILVYIAMHELGLPVRSVGLKYFCLLTGLTLFVLACSLYSTLKFGKVPGYIISQIILYNGLCLGLWFKKSKRITALPALLAVAGMTVVGFFWNWIAFTHNWWTYQAILGWMFPPQVPVDDWNFYIFAPLAAASLYEIYRPKRN